MNVDASQGLNNPNSAKEVSKELLPILNQLFASREPEAHNIAVTPVDERYGILMFGNVSLIVFHRQLANSAATAWHKRHIADALIIADRNQSQVDLQINYLWQLENRIISDSSFSELELAARSTSARSQATAKEGKEDDKNVNGQAEDAELLAIPESIGSLSALTMSDPSSTPSGPAALGPELFVKSVIRHYTEWLEREIVNGPVGKERRRREIEAEAQGTTSPTRKLLIAAALPPMVPDDALSHITEKYTQAHLPKVCRAPTPPMSPQQVASSVKVQTIDELLKRIPTICDLATRVTMTNDFNAQLREFCARHPSIFVFVDIGPAMKISSPDYHSAFGEVDRSSWADKLDKTNVHPLWEPTICLWQKELATAAGIPGCLDWKMKEDPEETLKKYEGKKQDVLDRVSQEGTIHATIRRRSR